MAHSEAPAGHAGNADQIAYWNGPSGQRWTDRQELQDRILAPVLDVLIDSAKPAPGEHVLDVGCGCGASTIAFAEKVGASGHVLGIDISAPMLERATQRAPKGAPVEFRLADATVHPFAPATFDLLTSRFGVMFFADPTVSFANLRKAVKPGARMAFACWREPRVNPWMIVPLQAAYKHVPKLPQLGPEDPGPFSFASEERVHRVLGGAGFSEIGMEPCDLRLDIAVGRGIEAAAQSALEIGPVHRALDGQGSDVIATVKASIQEALTPYVKGTAVELPAGIWIVTARNLA
jgi:SAM-dependent methyltransferase